MSDDIFRPIKVKADGTTIADTLRVRLQGSSNMTLLPDFFVVEIYNISSEDRASIVNAKTLSLSGEDGSLLCKGEIDDIYSRFEGPNVVMGISIVDGKSFWNTGISRTVGAGADLRSTLSSILLNASFGGWSAENKRLFRGQTFSGRLAECVSVLAKSADARAFITKGVVYVVAKGRAVQIIDIPDSDIIDDQSYATGIRIIKTVAKGYPVGAIVTINGRSYRMASQKFNLDNFKGSWDSSIILVDERELSNEGMVGG